MKSPSFITGILIAILALLIVLCFAVSKSQGAESEVSLEQIKAETLRKPQTEIAPVTQEEIPVVTVTKEVVRLISRPPISKDGTWFQTTKEMPYVSSIAEQITGSQGNTGKLLKANGLTETDARRLPLGTQIFVPDELLPEELKNIPEKYAEAREGNRKLQAEVEDQKARLLMIQARAVKSESDLAVAEEYVSKVEAERDALKSDLAGTEEYVSQVEIERDALKLDLAVTEEYASQVETERDALQSNLVAMREEISELQDTMNIWKAYMIIAVVLLLVIAVSVFLLVLYRKPSHRNRFVSRDEVSRTQTDQQSASSNSAGKLTDI